jgi:hypothetical protein
LGVQRQGQLDHHAADLDEYGVERLAARHRGCALLDRRRVGREQYGGRGLELAEHSGLTFVGLGAAGAPRPNGLSRHWVRIQAIRLPGSQQRSDGSAGCW